jgi:hypothetical protein
VVKVTIEFQSLEQLARFYKSISCKSIVILPDVLRLTCSCEEKELQAAIDGYDCKVIPRTYPFAGNKPQRSPE